MPTVVGPYVVETFDNLSFSEGFLLSPQTGLAEPSLTNRGQVIITPGSSYSSYGVNWSNYTPTIAQSFLNDTGAILKVIGTQSGAFVTGIGSSSGYIGPTVNKGLIEVTSTSSAYGVYASYSSTYSSFANSGTLRVNGNGATGIYAPNGLVFSNNGSIEVSSGTAMGYGIVTYASTTTSTFDNTGTIRVTDATAALDSIAIRYDQVSNVRFTNSGTIDADYAFRQYANYGGASYATAIVNTGQIRGIIDLSLKYGVDTVTNSGTITGNVLLGGGNDVYDGQNGRLVGTVYGGLGADTLTGGAGADILYGDDAQESGQDGDDVLNGGGGDDRLYGQRGADRLNGGDGNDLLNGGVGADALSGGLGSDTFVYLAATDSLVGTPDTITDFSSGSDRLDLSAALGSNGSVAINRAGNATTLYFQAAGSAYTGQIVINGQVGAPDVIAAPGTRFFITGDAATDVLYGGDAADSLNGAGGNDHILGGLGADTLTGGAGLDVFYYQSVAQSAPGASDYITDFQTGLDRIDLTQALGGGGAVAINRSGGSSTVYFQAAGGAGGTGQIGVNGLVQGYDFAVGPSTTFYITCDAGVDVIYGSDLVDVIDGGGGDDHIAGGAGADTLTGGAGADTFYYWSAAHSTAASQDRITDFATGQDKINIAQMGAGAVDVAYDGTRTIVTFTPAGGGTALSILAVGQVRFTDIAAAAGVAFGGNGAPADLDGAHYAPALVGAEAPSSGSLDAGLA